MKWLGNGRCPTETLSLRGASHRIWHLRLKRMTSNAPLSNVNGLVLLLNCNGVLCHLGKLLRHGRATSDLERCRFPRECRNQLVITWAPAWNPVAFLCATYTTSSGCMFPRPHAFRNSSTAVHHMIPPRFCIHQPCSPVRVCTTLRSHPSQLLSGFEAHEGHDQ